RHASTNPLKPPLPASAASASASATRAAAPAEPTAPRPARSRGHHTGDTRGEIAHAVCELRGCESASSDVPVGRSLLQAEPLERLGPLRDAPVNDRVGQVFLEEVRSFRERLALLLCRGHIKPKTEAASIEDPAGRRPPGHEVVEHKEDASAKRDRDAD